MPGGNLRLLHVNKMREYKVQTVRVVYDIDDEFVFLTSAAPQCPRLQRWMLDIQRHDIEASHIKGSKLVNADELSRL
ncbi:hypothetical protein TNCV_3920761 [Trichonephila clavipes]|nr:hypothetical protein TNCV_3920761 [Trichonephila clavipes]